MVGGNNDCEGELLNERRSDQVPVKRKDGREERRD